MSNILRLAIVDPDDSSRDALKSLVIGLDVVWLEAECSRYEFFPDVVAQMNPDIGIISMDADPEKAIALLGTLREKSPACQLLVVSSSTDGGQILSSMRAGAREYLTKPLRADELVAALDRISHRSVPTGQSGNSRGCMVIAVAGASGGVGTTSLAVNLGCALAADESSSVALVDLDVSLGDADVYLDSIPDYTLADVAQNISRLDFTLLKRSLTKHASGLYLLPRPVQLQEASLVSPDDLQSMLGLLKATFSYLILDLSKSYSELDMVALKEAEHVLLVTQLDLPCLRNVVRLMMSFGEVEGLKEKTRIVVNRVGLDSGTISLRKAKETIGGEIYWQIPNDYRVMAEVRNNGIPLMQTAPRAGITHSIVGLAASIHDGLKVSSEEEKLGLGKWLKMWPNKGKSSSGPKNEPIDNDPVDAPT